jgi:cell wall-associated NlpC family hydrolase
MNYQKTKLKTSLTLVLMFLFLSACGQRNEKAVMDELNGVVEDVRRKYAPDPRDEVYDISLEKKDGRLTAKGVTTVDEARTELLQQLCQTYNAVDDSLVLLPDPALGEEERYGVVNVSVTNARMGADYAAEMGTQLLLGAPVQVLQYDGWWQIKNAEGYIAWVNGSSFVSMSKDSFNQWITAEKIIFTDICGFACESADASRGHVSDLVFGNLLKYEGEEDGFYKVSYPDGRQAYVAKSQSQRYNDWLSSVSLTEESIIRKALTLRGIPYSWGGTSTKAFDCSGFSKTVFLMHGIILLRDASQQAKTGIPVDIGQGYDQLRPGDLMFFGKKATNGKKERVRHVGIYKGDYEFIHAIGYVRINSLDSTRSNYDAHNTREFIRAARVIGAVGTQGIWRIDQNPLYQVQ